jgi:hypothetical protein
MVFLLNYIFEQTKLNIDDIIKKKKLNIDDSSFLQGSISLMIAPFLHTNILTSERKS